MFEQILLYSQLSLLGFSLAAPPGPVNLEMLKQGFGKYNTYARSIFTGFGAMTADLTIALSILFIGTEYLSHFLDNREIKTTLFLFNVVVILYIGISSLKFNREDAKTIFEKEQTDSDLELKEKTTNNSKLSGVPRQYITGFLLAGSSPWSYIWWITFGPVVLNLKIPLHTNLDIIQAALIFILGIGIWVLSYCTLLAISNQKASRSFVYWITKISSVIIILFAVKILFVDTLCLYVQYFACTY